MKYTSGDVPCVIFGAAGRRRREGVFIEGTRAVCFLSHQGDVYCNTGWAVFLLLRATNDRAMLPVVSSLPPALELVFAGITCSRDAMSMCSE